MESIAISQILMKLIKTSLLFAAAAAATQLDATDYRVEWSSGSAKMTAILSVDLAQLGPNHYDFHTIGPGTWLTGLKITATDGTVVSGPFTTLDDYRHGEITHFGQPVLSEEH